MRFLDGRRAVEAGRGAGATDPPGRRCIRIPIVTKLTLGFLGIISLISVVFMALGIHLISSRVVAEAQEKVDHDLNAARVIYQGELRHVADVVRLTAERFFLREAMLAGGAGPLAENKAIADEMRLVMLGEGLDVLTLVDATGQVRLRAGNVPRSHGSASGDEIVAAVLATGRESAGTTIVPTAELRREAGDLFVQAHLETVDTPMARPEARGSELDGMMLKAAAPVRDDAGTLLGVLYGGVLLNRNFTIVDRVKDTVYQNIQYGGRDIGTATIFQDDMRISTNVLSADGSRAIGTRASEEVYDVVVGRGERFIGRAFVVNDWYITAYEPIRSIDDAVIGMLYVGVLEERYTDIRRRAVVALVGIMAMGAIASMLLAWVTARRFTASLDKLALASHSVTEGNYDVRVDIASNDEMQDLADAFNVMAEALKRRDERLREIAQTRVAKSERLAMIGQLAAGVAHELNNPMQGIVTYAMLMLEDLPPDDPNREPLEKVVAQANRCSRIVRGLLDFSRARTSDRQAFDVTRVLEDCLALVGRQALFHNIEVVKQYQADLPAVTIDPSQMQQVFLNLIMNAAEAMEGQGRLTLRTTHVPADSHVVVEVTDTGHGIAPEDLEKVFVPFFTTKEAGHGVGLGLAISYNIVRSHNGTLAVESEVGRGTTFTVTLPVAIADGDGPDGR